MDKANFGVERAGVRRPGERDASRGDRRRGSVDGVKDRIGVPCRLFIGVVLLLSKMVELKPCFLASASCIQFQKTKIR